MNDTTGIFLFFILVSGIVLILLLLTKDKGSGVLKFGRAELRIDFDNAKGWVKSSRQPPGRPRAACYLAVKGTDWTFPLPQRPVLFGTGPECEVRLADRTAGSRQAVIYWQDGRYKIANRSNNRRFQTWVNDNHIINHDQKLGEGNTIQMGRNRFIFRDER
ncbi:protein of unknown function [Candidatus Promineifilum breve]|uniref:FHA domain-containing protein n=1 Tax=Candidatus Promineifilum breve TaxID=1806508 RepID=A0A160T5T9_9CHLR|nr:FHA domain-containing protein [Candidatus Promineifilum breve]CUS05741.1 protein of unknown function [Candidatus Promineifilum breve]